MSQSLRLLGPLGLQSSASRTSMSAARGVFDLAIKKLSEKRLGKTVFLIYPAEDYFNAAGVIDPSVQTVLNCFANNRFRDVYVRPLLNWSR